MAQGSDSEVEASEGYVEGPLPPLEIEVTPEQPQPVSDDDLGVQQREDPSRALDDFRFEELKSQLADLQQQLVERQDLHKLRKKHAGRLFGLTVCWVAVVWVVVLLQGFGQWFFPLVSGFEYIRFKLGDAVIIAFMTTTTATVLGLYGIAAYWLYGKAKFKHDPSDKDK